MHSYKNKKKLHFNLESTDRRADIMLCVRILINMTMTSRKDR